MEENCNLYDKLNTILKYLDSFVSKKENKRSKKTKAKTYIKIHITEKTGLYLELTNRRSKLLSEEIKNIKSKITLSYISTFDKKKKSFERTNKINIPKKATSKKKIRKKKKRGTSTKRRNNLKRSKNKKIIYLLSLLIIS